MKDASDRLIAKYPDLLGNVECGVWCPERWEIIIDDLCRMIKWKLMQEKLPLSVISVNQVKEKFAQDLRFYWSGTDELPDDVRSFITGLVYMAECWAREVE